MHTYFEYRKVVVKEYLFEKDSLRALAQKHNIHFTTLYRWVRLFKKYGEKGLMFEFKRNNSKKEKDLHIQEAVVDIKEKEPSITLKKAQKILQGKGIEISIKGIWSIWRRYGYCGFVKERISNDYTKSIFYSKKDLKKMGMIKRNLETEKEITKEISELPFIPDMNLTQFIPSRKLSLRTQLMKLYNSFGKIPINEFLKIARRLKKRFSSLGWEYSFLRAHYAELFALDWLGRHAQEYKEFKRYESKYPKLNDLGLKFSFYMLKCHSCMCLLKIKEGMKTFNICRRLILHRKEPPLALLSDMATFCSRFGLFGELEKWLQRMTSEKVKELGSYWMTLLGAQIANGEYEEAHNSLKFTSHIWGYQARGYYLEALAALANGNPQEALEYGTKFLNEAKKEGIIAHLERAIMVQSLARCALGQYEEGKKIVKPYLGIFKKSGNIFNYEIWRTLLTQKISKKEAKYLPCFRLLSFLSSLQRKGGARKVKKLLHFVQKERAKGIFSRYILFYPDILSKLLRERSPLLPSGFYNLSIINKAIPLFEIEFLGNYRIRCNGELINNTHFFPKEIGILLAIAIKKEYELTVENICQNFWPDKELKLAKRYLYTTLNALRQKLSLTKELLTIKEGRVVKKFHCITDWLRFQELIAEAKALFLANEYSLAIKKYKEGFRLFRGEPFKKNFDDWSVNMRFKILSQLETEAINFAKSCLEHKNKNDALRILEKVLKVIPNSEEIQKLLDGLMVE